MRDATTLEGEIFIGDDTPLVLYLANRKGGWMNMVRAHRLTGDERPGHLIVHTDHIMLAFAPDANVPVLGKSAMGVGEREVKIALADGSVIAGILPLARQQRLSDYLGSIGTFLGVKAAKDASGGRILGDVVIHSAAIMMLREARE